MWNWMKKKLTAIDQVAYRMLVFFIGDKWYKRESEFARNDRLIKSKLIKQIENANRKRELLINLEKGRTIGGFMSPPTENEFSWWLVEDSNFDVDMDIQESGDLHHVLVDVEKLFTEIEYEEEKFVPSW